MNDTTEVPNSPQTGSPQGTPQAQGSGAPEVEEYKKRLSGLMSAMDKLKQEHEVEKQKLTSEKESLQVQLMRSSTELAEAKSLVSGIESKLRDAESREQLALSELARYEIADSRPWLRSYRELLPKTTDKQSLEAVVKQLEDARTKDIDSIKENLSQRKVEPPVVPAAPMTKDDLRKKMMESAGTPAFDALYEQWQALVSQK